MAKYNVHAGHNSIVPGASKYLNEVTENRKVKNKVIQLLKAAGHTVYDCTDDSGKTVGANLANIVAKCNKHTVDLDISIHLNAGGGTGTEVFYYTGSATGKTKAAAVSQKVAAALGIRNRGAKASSGLYVLRNTKATAILVECCFVDSKTDQGKWNVDKCAAAIVEAITGKAASSGSSGSGSDKPAASTSKPAASASKTEQLKVDGWWGKDTTKRLQRIFKTPVDGIVSNQDPAQKKYLLRADSGSWDFKGAGNGSDLIGAMQRYAGEKDDGFMGAKTIKAWQKKLGVTVDGYMGENTVKKLQQWINKQK